MKAAVGYVRVSTQGQAQEGVSMEMQRTKIEQWAALNDAKLLTLFADEGISGKSAKREGLQAALALVKRHKAALVVYSLSRLSRSTKDTLTIAEQLEKGGCDLVVLNGNIDTTTPSGRMAFRMLAAINEFEREQISARTKEGLAHKKQKGERVSRFAPIGYGFDGGQLVPVAAEQEILKMVGQLRKAGMSQRAISAALAERGAFNRAGKPFSLKVVQSMLKQAA